MAQAGPSGSKTLLVIVCAQADVSALCRGLEVVFIFYQQRYWEGEQSRAFYDPSVIPTPHPHPPVPPSSPTSTSVRSKGISYCLCGNGGTSPSTGVEPGWLG